MNELIRELSDIMNKNIGPTVTNEAILAHLNDIIHNRWEEPICAELLDALNLQWGPEGLYL